MPSHQLLLYFQKRLNIEESWRFNGSHYEKTSLAWLNKMDANKKKLCQFLVKHMVRRMHPFGFKGWRIFFMAWEVLFGYDNGNEWGVSSL